MNRLLVETDGPTALEWVNGEYGYPSVILNVVKRVSERKEISTDRLLRIIEDNFFRLTGIKIPKIMNELL